MLADFDRLAPVIGPHTQPGITIGFADVAVDRPVKQTPVGQSYRAWVEQRW